MLRPSIQIARFELISSSTVERPSPPSGARVTPPGARWVSHPAIGALNSPKRMCTPTSGSCHCREIARTSTLSTFRQRAICKKNANENVPRLMRFESALDSISIPCNSRSRDSRFALQSCRTMRDLMMRRASRSQSIACRPSALPGFRSFLSIAALPFVIFTSYSMSVSAQ